MSTPNHSEDASVRQYLNQTESYYSNMENP